MVFFSPRGSESHRSSVIVDTPKNLGHLDSEPTASVIICPATGYGRQLRTEEIFNATVQIHPLVSFHTSSTRLFLPIHSLIPSPDFSYPRSSVVSLRQTSCSFRWIIGRGLEPAYTPDRSFSPIAPTPRPPPPTSLSRRLARSPIRASHAVPKGPLWTRSSLLFSGSQPAVIEVHYVSPGTGVLVPRFYTMTIRNGSIFTHCPRV